MATLLRIREQNTAPPFEITCDRDDGTIIDLTGASITIKIVKGSTTTQAAGVCTIVSATEGTISYTPEVTDFPSAGTYKGDVRVIYGDGTDEVLYEQLKVKAKARL